MIEVSNKVIELDGISPQEIPDEVLNSTVPLILKDFAASWPIVKAGKDSAESASQYLKQFYNGRDVVASYGEPGIAGRIFYNEDFSGFNFRTDRVNLNLVLDRLIAEQNNPNPSTMYVASTEINSWLPGFIDENSALLDELSPLVNIWIGNKSRIAAHYDFPVNLACSVVGRRRFTLFPPEQISNLYPGPIEFAPGGQEISMVDFHQPDFERFPKFKHALKSAFVANLNAGDALLLPSMWWHHVEGLDSFNVLLTHWWRTSPAFMGRPGNALLAAILSLRGLNKTERQAWKGVFEHYVFDHENADSELIPSKGMGVLETPMDEDKARQIRADLINKLKR